MTNDDLRFSPRSNRAREIAWETWGDGPFQRARDEDKPILLSISAVWCHWCHVMDETSYSDPQVIAAINERYVPIRVDNDRRPDVNARYNMGGWPTTAFLAPDGTTLTGATYLPPPQMLRALQDVAAFYAQSKDDIHARTERTRVKRVPFEPLRVEELNDALVQQLVDGLRAAYDTQYGGFGDAPKFPQPELLEFLLARWRATGEQDLYEMVARTILGMSRGGTYDSVEGGFFRYSTTRDWSVPHFEKMAEDHAGLLRVLSQLALYAPAGAFHAILASAAGYVRRVLRDPESGLYAGSQDADEAYYALPLDDRREHGAPYVDRTSYTNWTCALAGSSCLAARALGDDIMRNEALTTLDSVDARLLDDDGLAYHFVAPGGSPQVRGLLADQAAYARALLDAHEVSGEERFLERARALVEAVLDRFSDHDGGFVDHVAGTAPLGRLALVDRPVGDNGLFAEVLLRASALFDEPRLRERAERTLVLFATTFTAAGPFGATYARALQRYLSPETSVRIVGETAATEDLRESAAHLALPFLVVRTVAPSRAGDLGLPSAPAPAAYLCTRGTCGLPARDPRGLRAAYEALRDETPAP